MINSAKSVLCYAHNYVVNFTVGEWGSYDAKGEEEGEVEKEGEYMYVEYMWHS